MKKYHNYGILVAVIILILFQCLFIGCGTENITETGQENTKTSNIVQVEQQELPEVTAGTATASGAAPEAVAADEALAEIMATREAVITLGGSKGLSTLQKTINAFNNAQDKYWVVLKEYESRDKLLLDLARKQGADIYYMDLLDLNSLVEKGVIEELTAYFENSEVVNKEDIIESVWRAGSIGEGMYYVIPRFEPGIYLVEKGYTDNGTWTIEDYFALAEKYPDGMLSEYITEPNNMLLNDVRLAIDSYINWEERTCSFDSEEFIALLEQMKLYGEKTYGSVRGYSVAEQMEQKMCLTKLVYLTWFPYMTDYKSMRDSLLDFCEIAGMPNDEGKLKYIMEYREIYGINAGSENKEAAWAFLEYILSKEYQASLKELFQGGDGKFSVRLDVLEESLDEEIGKQHDSPYVYKNSYTGERVSDEAEFTEEDKKIILDILMNCYCSYGVSSGEVAKIIKEESAYFFEGTKSAEEVAKIIQNRMSLYLME